MMNNKNPLVFFDISVDRDIHERMIFELFSDLVPKTAEKFRALCTGENGKPHHYKGSFFHEIVKQSLARGGYFFGDGSNVESINGGNFSDELPKLPHDRPGLLTMAVADSNSCGSMFTITFSSTPHLDRDYVVFGRLVQGYEVLKKIEDAGDEERRPAVTVEIVNSGELQETGNQKSDKPEASKSSDTSKPSDKIEPGSLNPSNLDAKESSSIHRPTIPILYMQPINPTPPISTSTHYTTNFNFNESVDMPFGLDANDISSIASDISAQEEYIRTLEKLPAVNINSNSTPSFFESMESLILDEHDNMRGFGLEDSESKKRRKTSETKSEGGSAVCCKCARSQCLKRYCECFSVGKYCDKACTCQGCYNQHEYEYSASEARKQVESRNPHEFAPKTESESHLASSAANPKKVCSCKKSTCSKKYCDCFKAGEACSDECHCEGCKNTYGTKREAEELKTTCNDKLKTPFASVDSNNEDEDSSKAQFPYGGFPTQDLSDLISMDPCLLPASNTANHQMILENSQKFPFTNTFQGEPSYNATSGQADEFSQTFITNDPGSQLYELSDEYLISDTFNLIERPILPHTNMFTVTTQNEPVEVEMPKILNEASNSQNGLKVSSPNKKRIIPPSD